MEIYRGKVLHSGIAAGKIHILERGLHVEKKKAVADVEAEVNRYLSARETAEKELMCLKQQAEDVVGTENAAIFGAQAQLLSDSELSRGILDLIRSEKANAEYAVFTTAPICFQPWEATISVPEAPTFWMSSSVSSAF